MPLKAERANNRSGVTGCVRSRTLVVLLGHRWIAQRTASATPWFIGQAFESCVQKPLRPFVDKTAADPHGGGRVGDGHPISEQENNPATSGKTSRHGRGSLPREERLTLRRRQT